MSAYHAYVHTLFWTGLRPSEASGLQWRDVDLRGGRLHVQRSRHLYEYGAPKTDSADRWVELFPETVALLTALQPLHVRPEQPIFVTTRGTPIEPKTFSAYWSDGLRACGIRQRGLYATKDTYVTTALSDAGVTPAWIEQQTGVAYATLRKRTTARFCRATSPASWSASPPSRRASFRGGRRAKVLPKNPTLGNTGRKRSTKRRG
jgi:integrase